MLSCDILCRAAVYPRFEKSGQFDFEALIHFSEDERDIRRLSLASRWLCGGDEGVHEFGREVAKSGNRRLAEQNKLTEETMEHYLGFYSLRYGRVRQIQSKNVDISVYWKAEAGLDQHFEVKLTPDLCRIARCERKRIEQEQTLNPSKQRPNLERRIKNKIRAEVRAIRRMLVQGLFGPTLEQLQPTDPMRLVQRDRMPSRPEVCSDTRD